MSNLRSKQSPDILRKPVDQFTLNFLRKKWELSNEDDFVFCPIGIITINIMLLEGAQGKTADQIMSILHLEPTFKSVEDIRNQLKMVIGWFNGANEGLDMRLANEIIINKKKLMNALYRGCLEKNYSASIHEEDFEKKDLIKKLDAWIATVTNNLVPNFSGKPFEEDDILILINVLYFRGLWLDPFVEGMTREETFHNFDGTQSIVKMMILRKKSFFFSQLREEDLEIIRLPYETEVAMFIFMPMKNDLRELIFGLTAEKIEVHIQLNQNGNIHESRLEQHKSE